MSSANTTLSSTLLYIQKQIVQYIYSCYLIFGITGCCLNILLLIQRPFRTVSCCTYFIVSSCAMLVTLCVGTGSSLYALNHCDPRLTIVAFCKLRPYINQSSSMTYRWCLTAACFDRFALSSSNVRLRQFANIKIARRVILVIIPIWLILPIHILILYNIRNGSCAIFSSVAAALYHSLFTTIMGCILPVLIMVTCSLLIHHNLTLKRQRRQQNANSSTLETNETQNLQRKRDHQALLMLLIQVIVYAILTIPLMAFYFYNAVSLYVPNKSSERITIENFAMFLSESPVYLFSVLSFYLYTLASCSFRSELIKLLHSIVTCKYHRRTNRIESMPNNITNKKIIRNQTVGTETLNAYGTNNSMSKHNLE